MVTRMVGRPIGSAKRRAAALMAFASMLVALGFGLSTASAVGDDGTGPVQIQSGKLEWGVKYSFNGYAGGGVTSEGATSHQIQAGTVFGFPLVSGSFDPELNETVLQFSGKVRWISHCEFDPCALDLSIANPRVELLSSGTNVYADVISRHEQTGQLVEYPNANIARLDVSGIDPVEENGETKWDGIPSALTAMGVAPFAGFYQSGQELAPVYIDYTGPGGKPIPEPWSVPGTPLLSLEDRVVPAGQASDGLRASYPDAEAGVVHVVSEQSGGGVAVQAYDTSTVAPEGTASTTFATGIASPGAVAFDAVESTVFVGYANGGQTGFRALKWTGSGYAETELSTGTRIFDEAIYDPISKRLHGLPAMESMSQPGATLRRSGEGWATAQSSAWPSGWGLTRRIESAAVTTTGQTIVATSNPSPAGPAPFVKLGIGNTGFLTPTDISGQASLAPYEEGSKGFTLAAAGSDGSAYVAESFVPGRVVKLRESPDGWVVGGDPIRTGLTPSALGVDTADDLLYVGTAQNGPDVSELTVLREGAKLRQFAMPADPAGIEVGADGTAVVADGSGFTVIRRSGASPGITAQPESVSVEVPLGKTSTTASFKVTGTGDPAPQVSWQERIPGSGTGWTAIEGAAGSALSFEAGLDHSGRQYRAILTNSAGEIATNAATLTVTPAPPVVDPPDPVDPGKPEPKAKPKLKAVKVTAKVITFRVTAAARITVRVEKKTTTRNRKGKKVTRWKKNLTRAVKASRAGSHRIRFPRPLKAGAYRVKFEVKDTAGKRSQALTRQLKVRGR